MNKNFSIFNSIYSFDQSFSIINDKLIYDIFNQNKQINNPNEIYIDHLLYLKNIKNFSLIKYFEQRKEKSQQNDEVTRMKSNHFSMQIAVLKRLPQNLINEIEKSKIDLFISWNKGITKKTFPEKELDNYIKKIREYSSIIGSIFKSENQYEALIKYHHPQFSSSMIENLFKKISLKLKESYANGINLAKKIKIPKCDKASIKNDQYESILKYIISSFCINGDKEINSVAKNSHVFFDEKLSGKKYIHDFATSIIDDLSTSLQEKFSNIYHDNSIASEYNSNFLSLTLSYFFSFYLLRSKEFLFYILEQIQKTQKTKIFEEKNFFWLFNKLSDSNIIKSCDEISQMFYSMLQYTIERDLICGKISAKDVPEIWASGIKHYFNIEVKSDHILQNFNFALGKFGNCVFQSSALIGAAMIFEQYNGKTKDEEKYNKNYIKKFLNDITIDKLDYLTYALINEIQEKASDAFLKISSERFSLN